jgi:hypothetical protein
MREGCSRRVLLNKRAVCLIILLHFAAIEAQPDRNICTDIIIIHVTPEAARRHQWRTNCAHTQTHAPQARQGRAFFRPFLCSNPNCCLSTRCKYKKKRSWRMWTTAIVFACRQIVLISVEKLLCWEKHVRLDWSARISRFVFAHCLCPAHTQINTFNAHANYF